MALDQPFLTSPARPFLLSHDPGRGSGRAWRAERGRWRLRAVASRRQLLRRALQRPRLALTQR